jgi:hypothetical protein
MPMQGTKGRRGHSSNPIATSALEGGAWSATYPGKDPVLIVQEVRVGLRDGLAGDGKLPTGNRNQDRPARNESAAIY